MKLPVDGPTAVGQEFIALSPEITLAIHSTLIEGWGYASRQTDVTPAAHEVPITERLRDGMRQALKDLRAAGHAWAKALWIFPGAESRSLEALVPDGITDIPIGVVEIFLQHGEHDPHAIVECKRIAGTDANLCREYVVEGIDRFRLGKYAHNHLNGFMVGYVLSDTPAAAVDGINKYLAGKGRVGEDLHQPGCADTAWASQHKRTPPSPEISLHHLFVEFAGSGPPQPKSMA